MKRYFVIIFSFLLVFNSFSKNKTSLKIEKLKQKVTTADDTEKPYIYAEISKNYRHFNLDSCFHYAEKIKKLYPEKSALYNSCLSIYYSEKNNPEKAIQHSLEAIKGYKKLNDTKNIAYNYAVLGRIYQIKSDHVKASKYYFHSLKLLETEDDSLTRILIYKNLAFLFLDQKDHSKSLDYAFKAYAIASKIKSEEEIGFTLGVIGEIYRLQKKTTNSEKYFSKSYSIFSKNNNEYGMAWVLTNWSLLYEKELFKCYDMEMKAQKIWNEISPRNTMSIANQYNIAYCFMDLYNNPKLLKKKPNLKITKNSALDSAEIYFNKSLSIAEETDNLQWIMYSSGSLSQIYYIKEDFSRYTENTNKYHKLKDSIFSQENKNEIARLESQKEIELRDKQIQLNKLTLEAKEKQKWYFISGILMLSIIGFLLFIQNRNRKKTNRKLQLLNTELDQANKIKAQFFSILNHDLRSPITNLIHFLHLQKDNPELMDEATKNRMQNKTISGAENLLSSMEDILLWSKGQMKNFKPEPKKITVHQLFEDNKKVFSGYQNIIFDYQYTDSLELFTDENYLKTIIRNLTSNAINVFTSAQNPTIIWKAWQENGKSYLSISDNGKGADSDRFKALYDDKEVVGIKSGLGLHLIRDLAKAIDCEITVDSKLNEGTTFILTLK